MDVDEPGVGAPAGNRELDACVVERLGKPESSGRGSCGRPRRRRGKCADGRALARRVYSALQRPTPGICVRVEVLRLGSDRPSSSVYLSGNKVLTSGRLRRLGVAGARLNSTSSPTWVRPRASAAQCASTPISLARARASAPRAARAIVGKWVPQWTSVGASPDRRPLL